MTPSPKITAELGQQLVSLYLHPAAPYTQDELVQYCYQQGVEVSKRTISTKLNELGANRLNPNIDCPSVRLLVASLYFQQCLPDKLICEVLKAEGYPIALRTFVQLRKSMGIKRKHSLAEYEARHEQLKDIISRELDNGTISSYGRTMLHTYFKSTESLQMMIGR
jgi:hypothetical protein